MNNNPITKYFNQFKKARRKTYKVYKKYRTRKISKKLFLKTGGFTKKEIALMLDIDIEVVKSYINSKDRSYLNITKEHAKTLREEFGGEIK